MSDFIFKVTVLKTEKLNDIFLETTYKVESVSPVSKETLKILNKENIIGYGKLFNSFYITDDGRKINQWERKFIPNKTDYYIYECIDRLDLA